MKFKLLSSMSHNFTHSFVSLMNYVDDGYVYEDIFKIAKKREGEVVSVQWMPKIGYEVGEFNTRIVKSIKLNQDWLPKHFERHNVEEAMISEMRTDVVFKNGVFKVIAYLKDSRGKEYESNVQL